MKEILKAALTICEYCNTADCRNCIFCDTRDGKCLFEQSAPAYVLYRCKKPEKNLGFASSVFDAYSAVASFAGFCTYTPCSVCPLYNEECVFRQSKRPWEYLDVLRKVIEKQNADEKMDELHDALSTIARECKAHNNCEGCHLKDKSGRCYKETLPVEWYDAFFKLTKED